MPITRLEQLYKIVKDEPSKRLAVACGEDPHTIEAVARAVTEGLVNVTMTGDENKIKEVSKKYNIDPSIFEIIHEPDKKKATKLAVSLIRERKADFLMKGLVDTAIYMRAILDKETGLIKPGRLLSHVTIMDVETYPKLLIGIDVAVIISPTLEQKVQMINYATDVAHTLGIENPKVAILAAVEKVNEKMPATVDAAILSQMNRRKQIKGCTVDGPLAFDLAVSKYSKEIKGVDSEVAGDADILVFPDIEAGNILYKSVVHLAKGSLAAIVVGADVPCILTSRGDSELAKFYSIALAAKVAERRS